MRTLKLQMQISVDGYVAGPNGELDWMTFRLDDKLGQCIDALADSADTILLGRKMTDGFVAYWEGVIHNQPNSPEFAFAKKMVETPKVVFSRTLEKSRWANTTLATGNLADEIADLKKRSGKDLLVYGGAGFVSSLIAGGHIDEFNFFINPILINKGMRIFDLLEQRQPLSLIDATPYASGVTVVRYQLKQ